MNQFCIVITLILIGYLKSVFGSLFINDNQLGSLYKSNYQNELSKVNELLQSLNLENYKHLADYQKNEDKNFYSVENDTTEEAEIRLPQDELHNDNAVRILWNTYIDLLEQKTKSPEEKKERDDTQKYEKRALTMLSRWKPFRLNNLNSGNGRHVIRSPFTSRSDPNSFNRIQIMGRPFRWG